ncbi:MAG: hypothetical protein JRJ12_10975 [Deltaproteobacteria bacterium]|nr:hypothetical protein [Deltaproteobacteria bacterium]MBW2071335.1 hypothetical protein [Deltaproteobacteria bacterium]
MVTLNMSEEKLKELIREAIISTLTERSDLLEDAVAEAILDMKLAMAIEEGDTGQYVDEKDIISKLAD